MAITVRKGIEGQFDINKMLPGEFAVTTDTHKVYICMAAGISKELASVEELQNILGASDEAFQAFQELLNAMESDTVITGLLTDVNNIKSGEYTISFAAAETRENIEPTDTLKVIFGKIKKFFTDLAEVALTGKYEDLSGTPTLSKVATSGSYGDLQDAPTLGDAASKAVANNMTTSTAGTHVADAYQVKLLKDQLDEQNTKIAKDLSWSPTTLMTGTLYNTKTGEYEYLSIPELNQYQEVEVWIYIGDAILQPFRVNRAYSNAITASGSYSTTYAGKISVHIDFENNRIGVYTYYNIGWNLNNMGVKRLLGLKLV